MAKWSVMLVLALVVVHASARNVPTTITMPTSTTPSGAVVVDDQKNFLTYGGVGGFSGIGSNGLPFGGAGSLGRVIPFGGRDGLGGLGGAVGGIGGVSLLGGVGGLGRNGGTSGLDEFGGLGGDGGAVGGSLGVGGGVDGGVGTSVHHFP